MESNNQFTSERLAEIAIATASEMFIDWMVEDFAKVSGFPKNATEDPMFVITISMALTERISSSKANLLIMLASYAKSLGISEDDMVKISSEDNPDATILALSALVGEKVNAQREK